MDILAVIAMIEKGLAVIEALNKLGNNEGVQRAVKIMTDFVGITKTEDGAKADDIDATEAALDALLDEFNAPLPEEDGA